MAGLLTNLIERQRGTAAQVEPRPRSQYEANQAVNGNDTAAQFSTADQTQPSTDSNAITDYSITPANTVTAPTTDNQSSTHRSQSTQKPQQQAPTRSAGQQPDFEAKPDALLKSVAPLVEPSTPPRQKDKPAVEISDGSSASTDTSTVHADDLEQRIESLLARLPPPHQPVAADSSAIAPPALVPSHIDAPPAQPIPQLQQAGQLADQSDILQPPSSQHLPDSPQPPTATQPGLLETPAWLNKLQSGLRHQSTQHQAAEPPTVNVTIGRVEVKAQRPAESKKTVHKKKMSTVMSLDDYLKQNGGHGQL